MIDLALSLAIFIAIGCLLFVVPIGAVLVISNLSRVAEQKRRRAKVKEINDEFKIPERFRHLYD